MNLVRISDLYHLNGSNVLLYLAAIYFLAVAIFLTRWAPPAIRKAGLYLLRAITAIGGLVAFALCIMELFVFRLSCPLCLLASIAVLAAFSVLLLASRRPAWKLLLSGVLAMVGFGFLFPFGGIPKIYRTNSTGLLGPQSHVLGENQSAPVLVEFADFECHACAIEDRAISHVWSAYKGRIRYSFRHMPIVTLHPGAGTAAIASECAGFDGQFWESKRILFDNGGSVNALLNANLVSKQPALSATVWQNCIAGDTPEHRAAAAIVAQDERDASRLGLFATPSLLSGSYLIVGAMSQYRIGGVIDAVLRTSSSPAVAESTNQGAPGCPVSQVTSAAACSK